MSRVFSIVTPTFNQGKFIGRTIESILSQPGDFFVDYVIMDGGSTDETVEVIKKYEVLLQDACEQKQVDGLMYYCPKLNQAGPVRCLGVSYRWKSEKDRGQSDAIIKGFQAAQGDIWTWLNSDDVLEPLALPIVGKFFQDRPQAEVVCGGTIAEDENGKVLWKHFPEKISLLRLGYSIEGVPQPSVFYTAKLYKEVGGVNIDLRYTMDADLWLKFMLAGRKFHLLNMDLSRQTYHSSSKSCEGGQMFSAFGPENKKLRAELEKKLGRRKYIYRLASVRLKFRRWLWRKLPVRLHTLLDKLQFQLT